LREWFEAPTRFPRIQSEPVVRLLGGEYADRGVLVDSLRSLEVELDELDASLVAAREREAGLPHRVRALAINRRLAQRIVDAHREWIEAVRDEA